MTTDPALCRRRRSFVVVWRKSASILLLRASFTLYGHSLETAPNTEVHVAFENGSSNCALRARLQVKALTRA